MKQLVCMPGAFLVPPIKDTLLSWAIFPSKKIEGRALFTERELKVTKKQQRAQVQNLGLDHYWWGATEKLRARTLHCKKLIDRPGRLSFCLEISDALALQTWTPECPWPLVDGEN